MTEIPYPQPLESTNTLTSNIEANVDQATEANLAFAMINIEAYELTQNIRPVRHHESSPY